MPKVIIWRLDTRDGYVALLFIIIMNVHCFIANKNSYKILKNSHYAVQEICWKKY